MEIKKIIKSVGLEIIYLAVAIVFLASLNNLNRVLMEEQKFSNSFELLAYKEYLPLKYFTGALILGFIGLVKLLKNVDKIRYRELSFEELVTKIVANIVLVIIIITLIIFINNPILKAIMTTTFVLIAGSYALSQN